MRYRKYFGLIILCVVVLIATHYINENAVIYPTRTYDETFSKSELTWFLWRVNRRMRVLFRFIYKAEVVSVLMLSSNSWIKLKNATQFERILLGLFGLVVAMLINFYALCIVRGQVLSFLVSMLPFPFMIWFAYNIE